MLLPVVSAKRPQLELHLRGLLDGYGMSPMNTRVKYATQVASGFLLLGLIGWGVYQFIAALVSSLVLMQSDVAVALVVAASTIVVSALSLVMSKRIEAMAAVRQELRAKKTPIYESIIGTMFKIQFVEKIGNKLPTNKELRSAVG